MAYEKIGFNKGDVLKAEHLNHIENELASADLRKNRTSIYLEIWKDNIPIVNPTLDELKENPDNYCFYSGDFEFTDTKYFNPYLSKNNQLYYTSINSVEVGQALIITINSSSSWSIEYARNANILNSSILLKSLNFTADFQLQLAFQDNENTLVPGQHDLVLMQNGFKVMDFRFLSVDPTVSTEYYLSYLGNVYGTYKFATEEPLFLSGSFIFHAKLISQGNDEFLLQGFLEFITPYVIELENFSQQTLNHLNLSLLLGQPIRLKPTEEIPFTLPLHAMSGSDSPILWFTGEEIGEIDGSIQTGQVYFAIGLDGEFLMFIKDPATGELIPQE